MERFLMGNDVASTYTNRAPRTRLLLAATVTALTLSVTALGAAPAHAQGSRTISGNIACNAFPNVAIGTTATAKGTVELSLNKYNNAGSIGTVRVGASSAYAVWGWKWWADKAGTYTAYAWGSNGAVSAANRYCQNIWS